MCPFKTVNVLGISFPVLNYEQTLEIFQTWAASKVAHQVCIANVHTVVTCLSDKELRDINNRSFVTMDGLPLVWYAKRVHGADVSRVCGPDLMLKCLDQGRNMGWKHFFLGGRQEVLDDLVAAMQKRYPDVDIVGWHSPPFRQLSEDEDNQLVELINNAKPDFLWVGLGAPKQEKWIAAHLDKIHVPVQLGVGAAFNFHSGHVMRAPLWMQKNGLEWLYRMFKDKRLIKRYLATNPVFLSLFARDLLVFRLLKRKVA
ncbi:MAG: WecB/TagA/CpsF family glycosyltransferase [Methylomonas sp.]